MSLAAARNAGAIGDDEERVASAAKPKKGNVLAKLFGFSTDEDEDEDCHGRRRQSRVAAVATKPAAEARIPLPQARPPIDAAIAARKARAGGFALASATLDAVLAARAHRAAPAGRGQPSRPILPPRAETTASITSWLNDAEFGRTDRVPPDMALAYAANAAPDAAAPPGRAHAADGRARARRRPRPRRSPASRPRPASATTIPGCAASRWRPACTTTMNVTVYGQLDVRQVRMMMIKPVDEPADDVRQPIPMRACRR